MPNSRLILFSEEDDELRLIVSEALRESGFLVSCAKTKAATLDLLASGIRPHCLLIDLNVAPEVARNYLNSLREKMNGHECPVMLSSGRLDLPEIAKACETKWILSKPYEIELILETIHRALSDKD